MFSTKIISVALKLIALGFLASSAQAANVTTDITHTLAVGNHLDKYHLHEQVSELGEREMVISFQEVRAHAPDSKLTVLLARDLDKDGYFDSWFYLNEEGDMKSIELPSHEKDGWDTAQIVLREHTNLKTRWLAGIFFQYLLNNATLTFGYKHDVLEKIAAEEIELLDLEIRAKRIAKMNPHAPELGSMYLTLSDGWAEIASQISIPKEIAAILADVILFRYIGLIEKPIGFVLDRATAFIAKTEVFAWAMRISERFLGVAKEHAAEALEHLRFLKATGAVVKDAGHKLAIPYAFAKLAVKERISILVKGLEARGEMGKLAARAVLTTGEYAKSAASRVPYMAWSQSLQLVSEIWNKRGVVYSPNPIIMAKRVASNKDLIQDMTYMTVETAITTTIIDRNPGLSGIGKAGIFSAVDSTAMSYWVKGSSDLKRNAIDTGWEVGIGNLQTNIDIHTLNYFESLSARSRNPKLKLVGYLVTGIDQFGGYLLYGKITGWYEKNHKKEALKPITLTPIFAPQG